jgi:acetyl-CoA C-acetyltransferase
LLAAIVRAVGTFVSPARKWLERFPLLEGAGRCYTEAETAIDCSAMSTREVFVVGAARTPIGKYGGALARTHPAELGARAVVAALERARIAPGRVDELIFGHGRQAGSGPNPARQVVRRAGLPDTVPAQTINQACASGLQAIALGAQAIQLGQSNVVVAGGMECMSRMPYFLESDDARWGHRMGDLRLVDAMYRDGFLCPLSSLIMGQTAEILARQYGITRDESDAYALESQRRAGEAISAGRFREEIVPAPGVDPKGRAVELDADEHPRPSTTIEQLRRLPPVFEPVDGQTGIITAGTSSGITDGGAAVVLADGESVASGSFEPLARVVGWATAGVDPRIMGIGPVPAVRKLLDRIRLSLADFDLVELNEAFAPQVLAVLRDLSIDPARVNVNGGAIALGHPIGCSGTRIIVTLVHEMRRRQVRRGLATLCVSGGLGMALAVERV